MSENICIYYNSLIHVNDDALDAEFYSYFACSECCLNHELCECEHKDE